MIGGVIGNYASRTFLPSLGFFSCNVFLLLVGIRYSYTFVAKVLEKYRSKGDKRNFWHDLIFRNCTVLRFTMKICGLGF